MYRPGIDIRSAPNSFSPKSTYGCSNVIQATMKLHDGGDLGFHDVEGREVGGGGDEGRDGWVTGEFDEDGEGKEGKET